MEVLRTAEVAINFGGLWAVNKVDFTINRGEVIGLIGPNGSGKTTFFNLVSGIYKPTHGKIFCHGQDITGLLPHQIKERGISRTFQSSRLWWDLSVLDNVIMGLQSELTTTWWKSILKPHESDGELRGAIEKAYELLGYFNKELIEKRFEQVKNIPHIDRRRIEICRALISNSSLLLLDEPSAGLNHEETMQMMADIGSIKERNKKISIIIIEHDMAVISQVSERVIVFNAGQKIAEGTFAAISKNEEVRRAYLGGAAS